MYDKQKIRNLFPGIENKVPLKNGIMVTGINFDNAATTPPLLYGIEGIERFAPWYSSIHRGTGYKSIKTTELYDRSRERVLEFVNADKNKYTVIYVKNTTEGLNKLSYRLIKSRNDVVLSTSMEHHSNDLPWRSKCIIDYVDVNEDGTLNIFDLKKKIMKYKGKLRLVTVTAASNVTGVINDIHLIAKMAHEAGALIVVDGAQYVPHKKISMRGNSRTEDIDYLVFSAHKMYAPFGIGAIIGRKDLLENGAPEYSGGGTIKIVTPSKVIWDDLPMKDEAGTPNVLGVVSLMASINMFNSLGLDELYMEEKNLTRYLMNNLSQLPVKIYGPEDVNNKVGIVSFTIPKLSHSYVAETLSNTFGIAVRNGCFCAHPYVEKLLNISESDMEKFLKNPNLEKPGLIRASLAMYNTKREVDRFTEAIYKICVANNIRM